MSRLKRFVSLVLVFALGASIGAWWMGSELSSSEEIVFETASSNGPNPFTPPAVRERQAAGPFGGTGSDEECDPELLIRALELAPDRLHAWAEIRGVDPADVPDYIRSLRPAILEQDTLVINHGFRNGRAYAFKSVLQRGTAVLVDEKGDPVVRCRCGNPLKIPPEEDPECPDEPERGDLRRRGDDHDLPDREDEDIECGCPEEDEEERLRRRSTRDLRAEDDECDPGCPEEERDPATGVTTTDVGDRSEDDECVPDCPEEPTYSSLPLPEECLPDDECEEEPVVATHVPPRQCPEDEEPRRPTTRQPRPHTPLPPGDDPATEEPEDPRDPGDDPGDGDDPRDPEDPERPEQGSGDMTHWQPTPQ